jgi:hypothetical protein
LFVSGVVLANASLDIAFHDKHFFLFSVFTMLLIDIKNSNVKIDNKIYNNEYIKMFWVGLMDGQGNIQVNHKRKKSLEYRFIIKLNNLKSNYNMLINIAKTIGGNVWIVNNNKEVIWVIDKKETVINTIDIFVKYPPLTSRLDCQLQFLKVCLKDNSVSNYLNKRHLKYNVQSTIIKNLNKNFTIPYYFPAWLSGFIEAEGCFSIRIKGNHSFSIGQKNDYYLLNSIKNFFNLSNNIGNPYKTFYSVETYKKEILNKIISHCILYPLLGEKSKSLDKFIKVFHK